MSRTVAELVWLSKVLAWGMILAGAAITGVAVWACYSYLEGWILIPITAIWVVGCLFFTTLAWFFITMFGLLATYLGSRMGEEVKEKKEAF